MPELQVSHLLQVAEKEHYVPRISGEKPSVLRRLIPSSSWIGGIFILEYGRFDPPSVKCSDKAAGEDDSEVAPVPPVVLESLRFVSDGGCWSTG